MLKAEISAAYKGRLAFGKYIVSADLASNKIPDHMLTIEVLHRFSTPMNTPVLSGFSQLSLDFVEQ